MKNIIKSIMFVMMVVSFFSCDPQDNDNNKLDTIESITDDQVAFGKTISDKSDNVITFTNLTETQSSYSVLWNLGDGSTSKDRTTTVSYPFAGEYTVSLTLYTAGGSVATKTEVIRIEKNDFTLLQTPAYTKLTGGLDNTAGVTWVIDQYNNYSKEVAKATGYNIKGHMGLGAVGEYSQEWWGADANAKANWTLYSHKFKFILDGTKLKIENKGIGYGRNASAASVGGFKVTSVEGEDALFDYAGGEYTFSLNESEKNPVLKLSGNAFLGYYCGTQDYEIFYQTKEVMALRLPNTTENQDWIIIYCREDLNVGKRPAEKALSEDFEGEPSMIFEKENLGDGTAVADNPLLYDAINSSKKVYRYEKSDKETGNLFYVAPTYKFDLTTQNKIKLQVMIPSYNVFNPLQPKVTIKLQDSYASDPEANEAKKEKTLTTAEQDKWVELEFDFSDTTSKKAYDKIIIQFGDEGHDKKGLFFFDNFSLVK